MTERFDDADGTRRAEPMARRGIGGRGHAARSRALASMHAMCVAAMLLIGIALIANHAAQPANIATTVDDPAVAVPGVDVSCIRTDPSHLDAGVRTPWLTVEAPKTVIVTDGQAVIQPHGEKPITVDAGTSLVLDPDHRIRYGASIDGPAAITIISDCA